MKTYADDLRCCMVYFVIRHFIVKALVLAGSKLNY